MKCIFILVKFELRVICWIKFAPYPEFLKAEKNDPKLTVLSQENNVYRSYISVMFIAVMGYIYKNISFDWCLFLKDEPLVLIVSLLVLFLFAYRKQTSFVRKRVENFMKNNKENKE